MAGNRQGPRVSAGTVEGSKEGSSFLKKRSKKLLFVLVVATTGARAAPLDVGSLLPGDYLEDRFMDTLRATRSPLAALSERGAGPQCIQLVQTDNAWRFVANENWHEGFTLFTITASGRMVPGDERVVYDPPKIDTPRHFYLRRAGSKNAGLGYSHVGDADAAVARIALAGTYVDRDGRLVEFGTDGVLHGMGPDTRFSLNNDHVVGDKFDYFIIEEGKKLVAFRHEGNRLLLYHVMPAGPDSPDTGEPDFKHLLLSLQQVNTQPPH
jgi:hypothetical protein